MKKSKVLISSLLAISMLLTYGGFVLADETDASSAADQSETDYSEASNDELAEQYILKELSVGDGVSYASYNYVSRLSGDNSTAYAYLRGKVAQIAGGEISDTVIALPATFTYTYTAAELGISDLKANTSLMDIRIRERLPLSGNTISTALLESCPFDLYWYDKEQGGKLSYEVSYTSTSVTVKSFKLSLPVAQEYQYNNNLYKVNTVYGQAVKSASATVANIVDTYASLDDYSKLLAYNNKICELVNYNTAASSDPSIPYGNPWQLIWVFDGDPSTDVVCEGYAKAFQYLCDRSSFNDSSIYALCVSGDVYFSPTNYGGHMLNVVHIGGANYLVDVSSNDAGAGNIFFLVGATGSVSSGYTLNNGTSFAYNQKMKGFYPEDALTLSGSDYDPLAAPIQSPSTQPASSPSASTTALSEVKLTSGKAHVQDIGDVSVYPDSEGILTIGTTGQGKRLEAITINFTNNTSYSGTLQYRVHVQDIGWMDWVDAGQTAGTNGISKRIEAIELRFTGDLANYYSVLYCVHIQDYGDMQGWVKDGALAGTTGESKRIEELKIKIVPKGSDSTMSVKYRVHVQDYGWEKSYSADGNMAGTSGESKRLEGIEIFLSGCQYQGGIQYKTHVQNIGWESSWSKDGEMSGTQGMSYRLEGISIVLYGEVSQYYDVYYRVHAQDIGWLSWACNGEYAGTAGRSARLEGIQIVLVPKGCPVPSETYQGITSVSPMCFVEGFGDAVG